MLPSETRLTVNELWHLALPPGTTLAGGSAGLHHPVEWVASLRAAYPLFGTLGENYLALGRLSLARSLDASLTAAYLIQELHHAQAAALVVDEPITAEDSALADRLALPILVLPEGAVLHEVERDVLRTLVDREGQLTRRELEARQHLQQCFGRGGIQAVVDELARFIGGEVIVTDQSQAMVSCAGSRSRADGRHRSVFPIHAAGRALGQMILCLDEGRHNPLDALYARQAAEICGLELLQRAARQETEERLGIDLVEQLLDEDQAEEVIAARLQRLGYPLAPDRRHVVLALGGAGPESLFPACHDIVRDLQHATQRDGANVLMANFRKHLVVFCACPASLPERRVRSWLQEALKAPAQACAVGVSRMVADLAGLREAACQALEAWELGQRISGRASPYYYEEMGLYRLLASLRARDELKRFYEETLGLLVRYDRAHNTDLVHTLEVFFAQNANASQTARALYVHRNTLNYRLQRIVEITGLDLNEAEARLAFQLALKLHHLNA